MKNINNEKGFTLIEVLVSIVIVAIGLLGYLGGNVIIGQTSESAYEQTVAYQDMSRVLETMRNTARTGTFPANVTAVYANGSSISTYSNLTNERIGVSYVSSTADPLDVTLTATWTSKTNRSMNKTLRTLITKRT